MRSPGRTLRDDRASWTKNSHRMIKLHAGLHAILILRRLAPTPRWTWRPNASDEKGSDPDRREEILANARHPAHCGTRADRLRSGPGGARHHRHAARLPGARRLRRDPRQRRLAAAARGRPLRHRDRRGPRRRHAGDPHPRGPPPRPLRRAPGQARARRALQAHRRSRPDGPHPRPRRARATTSSPRSTPLPASRSSTSPARAPSTRPTSSRC